MPYECGVQQVIPLCCRAEELRAEQRRAARQVGLYALERNCRSVQVGGRRLKAWRVPGTAEYTEHAAMVARLAEEFSGVPPEREVD